MTYWQITKQYVTVIFLSTMLLSACGSSEPPQVTSISVQPQTGVLVNDSAALSVEASGTNLKFTWKAMRGTISGEGSSVLYQAPETAGQDPVTVEVTSDGGTVIKNLTIQVVEPTLTPTPVPTYVPTVEPTVTPIPTDTPPNTSVPTHTPTAQPTPTQQTANTPTMTPLTVATPISISLIFADDFEGNLNNWVGSSAPINATLVSPGYDNSKFAVEVANDTDNSAIYLASPREVKGGNSYRVSVWCKANVGELCTLFFGDIRPIENGGYENSVAQNTPGSGAWQLLYGCKILTKDEAMTPHLYAKTTDSRVLYDNLRIEQVNQCVIPASPHVTPIINFDFEENLDGWEKCYSTRSAKRIEPGYNSGHAVEVSYIDNDNRGICYSIDNFEADGSYRVSTWCKANLGTECKLALVDLPNGDNRGYENFVDLSIRGNEEWQLLSACKKLTKEERISVHIYAETNSSKVVYDDVQVEKVDNCQ